MSEKTDLKGTVHNISYNSASEAIKYLILVLNSRPHLTPLLILLGHTHLINLQKKFVTCKRLNKRICED